jgi:hypothetical protein
MGILHDCILPQERVVQVPDPACVCDRRGPYYGHLARLLKLLTNPG